MQLTRSRVVPIILSAFLALPALLAAQEPVTITGKVTSDAGLPLGQVGVSIAALGVGGLSKDDGTYAIVIPGARVSGQTVTVTARRLGYKAQSAEITLTSGRVTHDFVLAANPLQLGEVVVTGAGTVSAAEKLGSVRNNVDSSLIQRSNEMNIVAALAGKAPNVEVQSQAGDPGASAVIRIRGARTLNGTGQPLIVVDGVPIDNSTNATAADINDGRYLGSTVSPNRASDVNPNDIASIEILKGAASGAIYGARAGQGVILITTKSGQPGPTKYSLRSSFSVDHVTHGVPLQTKYGQGTGGVAATCPAVGCRLTSGSWGAQLAPGTPVYDHFQDLFQTGYITDNNLTISGGNDRTLFYLSGEGMYNRGDMVGPNNHYQRATVRLKGEHRVRDNLTVRGNVAYSDDRGAFIQKGSNISGLLLGSLRTPPEFNNADYIDPATGFHRSYRYPQPSLTSQTATRGYDNPFFVLNRDDATGRTGHTFGNVSSSFVPLSWLKLDGNVGVDYSADERLEALAQSSSGFPGGQVISADFKRLQIDQALTATASYTLNPDVSGTFTLGEGVNSRTLHQIFVTGNNLITPSPFKLANTVDRSTPSDAETRRHTTSFFAQLTVDLKQQLYLTGGVRNDGSSTFGASDQRHWFPKASLAWDFTAALGAHRPSWLSYGKLRGAYGQTGQEPDPYQTVATLSTTDFGDGGWGPSISPTQGGRAGLYTNNVLPQPNIKPERTREFEGGADLAFFQERVDLHVTHYDDKSTDVIFLTPIPTSSGYGFQAQNAGVIKNVGQEVSFNVRPLQTRDASWEVGLQWGRNNNRVVSLAGAQFVFLPGGFEGSSAAAVTGSRVGVIYGTDFIRCGRGIIDPTEGNIDALCGASAPKDAVYLAADGYPRTDVTNRVIGDPTPDWTGSVRTSFQYKKWQISGLLDVSHGGQKWNGTKGALYQFGTHKDTEIRGQTRTFGVDYYDQFQFAGPGKGTAVLIDQDNWFQAEGSGFNGPSSQFVEDAGWVKLREVSLGYTLDNDWVRNTLGLNSIDVRVSGRNLVTWTNYTGIDPESTLEGAEIGYRGSDYFNHPQTRSFVFTLVLNR